MPLQYLRYEEKFRILWIDAICVDQQNIEERGHQVSRMADIYRVANPVIVWLGPESASSARAMAELSALGSTVQIDWASIEIIKVGGLNQVNIKVVLLSGEEYQAWSAETSLIYKGHSVSQSIEQLLDRLWFKRLWIWQEVCLGGNGVEIICGDKTMQWETFRNATWCIGLKPSFWDSKLYNVASQVSDMCYLVDRCLRWKIFYEEPEIVNILTQEIESTQS